MKLIKEVEINNTVKHQMAIYELINEEAKKYNAKYALLRTIFNDEELKEAEIDNTLRDVILKNNEGFFETEKEVLLYAYCVQMKIKIEYLTKTIAGLSKSARSKTPDFTKLRKDGDV